eukprot:CAMPEP_0172516034 /NCGR_PEP_ID=MMETSP1066-20121228/272768_1 /TAXON_ID=671091 /ORGANISM="Coscinodiscus wailesii, Strain CCMP2513" /LENGTH=574 /DNA_ID=CAMNT_0013297349 /DNA_START=1 /DNA_END=1725 /DNA_ORIENTATION=+
MESLYKNLDKELNCPKPKGGSTNAKEEAAEEKKVIRTKNDSDDGDDSGNSSDSSESDSNSDDSETSESEHEESTEKNVNAKQQKNNSPKKPIKNDQTKEDPNSNKTTSDPPTFQSLGLLPPLLTATKSLNWTIPTPIQAQTLPHALSGRDVIGLAETGSGKTGAFTLPLLQSLLTSPPTTRAIYALVLAPTRELAFQIHEVVRALGKPIGATSICVVGGVDMPSQAIALARLPHVVIATPGRLLDHLTNTKGFHLRRVRYLILDEADRMLSMDFEEEINKILEVLPDASTGGRRTLLFSATMTSKVNKLQRASLSDPVKIEVSNKFQTPETLLQYYLFIPAKYKDVYLTYLVNEFSGQSLLVFAATCNQVQRLAMMLRNLGFPAICLHGQMSQPKRLNALYKFKSGGRDIMICTDVASRGLDIPSVDAVINFDLPNHGKDYIHRVGRTARAGRSGKAIALVTQYDVEIYQRLEGLLGYKLPKYDLNEEVVLVLNERVGEARRLAVKELKEQFAMKGNGGRRKRKVEDLGEEGDVEDIVRDEVKKGYYAGGSGGRGGGFHNQRGSKSKGNKKYNH